MGSTTIQNAPQRDYAKETGDTLATQIALAKQLYESEKEFQPQYNQLQMQLAQEAVLGRESGFNAQAYAQSRPDLVRNWQNSLANPEDPTAKGILQAGSFENYAKQDWEGSGADPAFAIGGRSGGLLQTYEQLQPRLQTLQEQLNRQQRTADLADVASLGQQGQDAFNALNPELRANLLRAEDLRRSGNTNLDRLNAQLAQGPAETQFLTPNQINAPTIGATELGRENTGFDNISARDIGATEVGRENTGFDNIAARDIAAERIGSQGTLGYDAVTGQGVSGRAVTADEVQAQQMMSPGSVAAQQLGAARVAAPGQIGAERVGAALINAPQNIGARDVASQNITAQQIYTPDQIRAELIQPGTLGSSLYNQALNAGPSRISSALESAVLNNLTADGGLSAAEQRQAEQQVRASYAARGMAMSPQAISAEVQSRLVNQRQRAIENLGLAGQVNQQLQAEQAQNRGFAGNVLAGDVGIQQQNVRNQFEAAQFNTRTPLEVALANQSAANQFQQLNQQSGLQAQLANQQAGLTADQFNARTNLEAQQLNQDALLRAQLANQQAGIQTGTLNVQTGLQAGLANQDAENRIALANQQAGLTAQQFNVGTQASLQQANQDAALRAALANQQARLSASTQTAQFGTEADRFSAQQNLQAQLANQQAGMQTGQYNIGNATTLAQLNQEAALRAQLANQQTDFNRAQFNALNQSAVAQANRDAAQRGGLANQESALRAALANQQNYAASQQFNASNQSAVAQANRDAAQRAGMANQEAALRAAQINAGYNFQGQAANQQANIAAAEANRAFQAQQNQNYLQNLGQAGQLYSQNLGADRAYAAQLVGLRQATQFDPYAAILNRSSTAGQAAQNTANQGANLTQMGGPALFNPESSYANNIYGGNQQATNAANIATAQANAAVIGGAMQGLGSLAGGSLGAAAFNKAFPCWVAREVYGASSPKWKEFRTWLFTRAPKWFHDLYCKYGAYFAEFISNKPRTKNLIRRWMDSRIATLK